MQKLNDAVNKIEVVNCQGGFDVVITYCDGETAKWCLDDGGLETDLVDIFKELGFNAEYIEG